MSNLKYVKPDRIWLGEDPTLNEVWLQWPAAGFKDTELGV